MKKSRDERAGQMAGYLNIPLTEARKLVDIIHEMIEEHTEFGMLTDEENSAIWEEIRGSPGS